MKMQYCFFFTSIFCFFACGSRPQNNKAEGVYYPRSLNDTILYLGQFSYHDSCHHDTIFNDSIKVIRISDDSIRFYFPDFFLSDYPSMFSYKKMYCDLAISKKNEYISADNYSLVVAYINFIFSNNDSITCVNNFDVVRSKVHQKGIFLGKRIVH